MHSDERKQFPKSPYVGNKKIAKLITHNIQLDDGLFPNIVSIKPRKNKSTTQLNSKHKYQKKIRENRYQRFMMDLYEMNDVPDITDNKKVELITQSSKNYPTPQYFKWCSCHIYKSDRKMLNDETCYHTCELHPINV
jgi:hypothetical protein